MYCWPIYCRWKSVESRSEFGEVMGRSMGCFSLGEIIRRNIATNNVTRHRASTSTRWHFAFALCCHSNETRAPIANPPNRAQLGGTPYTISPSYIWVRAVEWACGRGQTHRHTDRQTDRRACPVCISRRLQLTRNVTSITSHYNGSGWRRCVWFSTHLAS